VIIVSCLIIGCGDKSITSSWSSSVTIDGDPRDWADLRLTYLEDEGAAIGIANDSDALYLMARVKDPKELRSLNMTGLKLWLGPEGRDKKHFMLNLEAKFLSPELLVQMTGLRQKQGRDGPGPDREFAPNKQDRPDSLFTCSIKDNIHELEIDLGGENGPAAAWGFRDGFLTLEFSVPLSDPRVRYYALAMAEQTNLVIGAEWGDPHLIQQRSSNKKSAGVQPGPPPGTGRGGGGFGVRGGRGGRGPQMELPEKREIWLKTELAGRN